MNPRVKSVKPLCDYQLLLEFTNDEVGIYDCKPLLDCGVFKELQDVNYFKQVSIVGDTVAWINEQDICPDTLYLESIMVDEITAIWYETIADVNNDVDFCSSEATLVFLFGCRLKNKFQSRITKIELEYAIYDTKVWGKNARLDFYVELDSQKIGFEFKYKGNRNTTDTHINAIHDLKRLCWLKTNQKIDKGYFLYATDIKSAINEKCRVGRKRTKHLDFITHNLAKYKTSATFPVGKTGSTASEQVVNVLHDIIFDWNGWKLDNSNELVPIDKYAWLTPIII